MNDLTDPKQVLDGADMEEDILYLLGYAWSLGNTKKIFPSEHCKELANTFLTKYREENE